MIKNYTSVRPPFIKLKNNKPKFIPNVPNRKRKNEKI